MNKTKSIMHAGYYHVTIGSSSSVRLLTTNTERAFIIAQLQDILSTRSLLEEPHAYRRLASYIDLLAFSLLPHTIQLVIFSISFESASLLATILMERLETYTSMLPQKTRTLSAAAYITQIRPLLGPYEALDTSMHLHLAHQDWEYDRYSSIGFYLHDRRGAWMRLWRLTHLYDNDPHQYSQLITHTLKQQTVPTEAIKAPPFETSTHG